MEPYSDLKEDETNKSNFSPLSLFSEEALNLNNSIIQK